MFYEKMTKLELVREIKKQNRKINKLEKQKLVEKNELVSDIEKEEKLLNLIFEHSLDSIVLLDKDFNFVRVSKTYAKSCQKEIAALIGKNHFEMYPSTLEDEIASFVKEKKIYSVKARSFTFPDHPEWGETFWDLGLVPILDENGEIKFFLFTLKDVTKVKKAEEEIMKINYYLGERVKELSCLFSLSKIIEKNENNLEAIFRDMVEILPQSWQYPEIATARIMVDGKEYKTNNFKETSWKQSVQIMKEQKKIGEIGVYYLKDKKFLEEEEGLLKVIAERLGKVIKRKEAEKNLNAKRKELEESNITLKNVLARIEEERIRINENIALNIKKNINPIIMKIRNWNSCDATTINLLQNKIDNITSDFYRNIVSFKFSLTPAEVRICDLVKTGYRAKEIADLLSIAVSTVQIHKENIRKKVGITNKPINLTTFLNGISP